MQEGHYGPTILGAPGTQTGPGARPLPRLPVTSPLCERPVCRQLGPMAMQATLTAPSAEGMPHP